MVGCGFSSASPHLNPARPVTHPGQHASWNRAAARASAELPRDHDIAVLLPGLGLKNDYWFVRICWY
jgi:hypothetical protein